LCVIVPLCIIHHSSSVNISTKFKSCRSLAEKQQLKFKSSSSETYNNLFSLDAISKSHDTAVGPDDIHYQMLKHLPADALSTLLSTLNNIWSSANFPAAWRTSTVIPVPKPGKDTSDPSNYRQLLSQPAFARLWSA